MKKQPNCKRHRPQAFRVALPVALILSLMCCTTALAVDETEAQTTITYTKTEPTPPSYTPADAPSVPLYEVDIPAELSLNTSNVMPLHLSMNNLKEGQRLIINIDGAKTMDENGRLSLLGAQTKNVARVLIGCYDNDGKENTFSGGYGTYPVAVFDNSDIYPIANGTLFFRVENDAELPADTYTGTVFFSMQIIG